MTNIKIIAVAVLVIFMNCALVDDLEESKLALLRKDYAVALQLLRPLADQGIPLAQYRIGLMTFNGFGVKRDVTQAIPYITAGAEGGVPEAQAFLAFFYLSSNTFAPQDFSKAAKWAKKAADQGNEIGEVLFAMVLLNGQGVQQDSEKALSLLQKNAAQDNIFANYELGKMMLVGRGIAKDLAQAKLLLKKSTTINSGVASDIDVMLEQTEQLTLWRKGSARLTCDSFICAGRSGLHMKRMKKAYEEMQWIELASRVISIGDREDLAYFYLGRSAEGIGDLKSAATYYKLALDRKERGRSCAGLVNNCLGIEVTRESNTRLNGVLVAIRQLDEIEARRIEDIRNANEVAAAIKRSEDLAAARLKELEGAFQAALQSASEGQVDAQLKVSQMYFSGTGVTLDEKAGVQWLLKAANNGHSGAQFKLSQTYFSGMGAASDDKAGMDWLVTAANTGNAGAQYTLGTMYNDGRIVEKSQAKAEVWFKKAATQGNESARLWLDALETERKKSAATAKAHADAVAEKLRKQELEKKQETEQREIMRKEAERKRVLENVDRLKSL